MGNFGIVFFGIGAVVGAVVGGLRGVLAASQPFVLKTKNTGDDKIHEEVARLNEKLDALHQQVYGK